MSAPVSDRKIVLPIVLAIALLYVRFAAAQDEQMLQRQIQTADQELNDDYKAVLRVLSKSDGEHLRLAERAWLVFLTKNEEAVVEVTRGRGNARAMVLGARLLEIRQRCEELRAMLGERPATPGTDSSSSAAADAQLNAIYQDCLRALPVNAERHFREAQRAWIDFRDKQRTVARSGSSLLTVHRVLSLKAAFLGSAPAIAPSKPTEVARERERPTPNPSVPDPFATAR